VRILVVEDERDLARAIAEGVRRDGYAVDIALDGADALDRVASVPYDIICLDLNLPDMDGVDVCRRIQEDNARIDASDPPRVLMLTARDTLADRVGGLDAGADDFMVKPFALDELLARLRALSRRRSVHTGSVIEVGPLRLDGARMVVSAGGNEVPLTAREVALLRYFMVHAGEVLGAERLLDHVWDENIDPFTNTVRVTISNLRRKLADAGYPEIIETVVGAGYRLLEF
jgi:DNA-binding response OmpR family regulator